MGYFKSKSTIWKLSCQNDPENEARLWKLDRQPFEIQI